MGCWIIKQIAKEGEMSVEQEQILLHAGIINSRMGGSVNDQYVDRVNNFGGGVRPLIVPAVL
jgi:hypothetical protein